MDCFGTYCAHVQTCDNVRVQTATQWTASAHTAHISKPCDNVRVPSAMQRTASVHTAHMSKPKCYAVEWFRTCLGNQRKKQLINSQRDDPHSFLQKLAVSFDVVKKVVFRIWTRATQFIQGRDEIRNVCVFPRKMLIFISCFTMIDPPNHHGHLRAANLVVYPIIYKVL